jgi:hypothetical protein
VTVASDPLVTRYDANNNGQIDRSEVITAINDYLFGTGANAITKAEVIRLINLYLFGPATAQPPGAPTNLTAMANGQTRVDLSWRVPASDGGAAITGYRVEVSTDGSSWSNLAANTNSAAASYSDTGLTAGSARRYRVSAINSAGTGPASNAASATTDSAPGGASPDLVVQSPTVSDSSPGEGASFTLRATVRNRGSGHAGGHGPGGRLGRVRDQQRVHRPDRAVERGDVLLLLPHRRGWSTTAPPTRPSPPATRRWARTRWAAWPRPGPATSPST